MHENIPDYGEITYILLSMQPNINSTVTGLTLNTGRPFHAYPKISKIYYLLVCRQKITG